MKRQKRSPFEKTRSTEAQYARELRQIAREIGRIISSFTITEPNKFPPLRNALEKYAEILKPWAEVRAATLMGYVERQDKKAWAEATKELSLGIREELRSADVGAALRSLMKEQVELITSLPRKAAERVHRLVIENAEESGRAKEIAEKIKHSGKVTEARATLIARTEVARASSVLTQVRAETIGSEGYIWRTAKDGDVRPSHRKMEGKFVSWDSPPTLDGLTGHAGTVPNCRCYPEPVIPRKLT